jgi:hypothetical protein
MSENCPLPPGETAIEGIPAFCMSHCFEQWDKAIKGQVGVPDFYDPSTDECDHDNHEVRYSHEGLQRPDSSPARNYSIVDQCGGCLAEVGETTYQFECPYSSIIVDSADYDEEQEARILQNHRLGF